ncbi:hypothetical protein QLL95_gp1237 [Cotonvirus japonicus]|uniref:Uncharacterized protein n=1 Tax=Cotonvirus japonicus TaxID=2811091 RepID=A0ABM7NS05_9VIRU|nr:hypothetical protein QLL95_gp1237 [Cotonvirus japonicus]BCS82886.1 hypothetical protein [Cotonvirus japonicus]
MLTYQELKIYLLSNNRYLKSHGYSITTKQNYIIISTQKYNYHITIFEDQWDDYYFITKKPYNLFHISSNNSSNKCSSYFWISRKTHKIQKIPKKYFKYNQDQYSFFSSTRNSCKFHNVKPLLIIFQNIINHI